MPRIGPARPTNWPPTSTTGRPATTSVEPARTCCTRCASEPGSGSWTSERAAESTAGGRPSREPAWWPSRATHCGPRPPRCGARTLTSRSATVRPPTSLTTTASTSCCASGCWSTPATNPTGSWPTWPAWCAPAAPWWWPSRTGSASPTGCKPTRTTSGCRSSAWRATRRWPQPVPRPPCAPSHAPNWPGT